MGTERRDSIVRCPFLVMRGSWVTTFAVGGVILLLTLFLGLQYNWLRQAGEAERERMHRRADADARNFADDVNREVQAALFNFQTDPASWARSDWAEFNERYAYWKGNTQYPDLIRGFVFFGKDSARPLRYDAAIGAFTVAEIPSNIISLESKLKDPANVKTFYEDEFALVLPVHKPERAVENILIRRSAAEPVKFDLPANIGFLVILLNKDVVTGRILPDLVIKHFPEGDFRVWVAGGKGESVFANSALNGDPDATAAMFDLTPDKMMFLRQGTLRSPKQAGQERDFVINQRIESQTFTRSETGPEGEKNQTFTVTSRPRKVDVAIGEPKSRTSVVGMKLESDGPWTLGVQHIAGSIDAFSANEFRKYFVIGSGIYLLLVGAIVAIVLSAMRSKRFAQRQIDFVSSVSHEFRTPLAVIYSASENLADGITNDSEQVARYGSLIKGEGRKLSVMVEQILQFAGARSGKRKYNFAPSDVNAVVTAAVGACAPILEEKGIQVETVVADGLPKLNLDTEAISAALQNLISNSVKYGNGSNWLRIAAENGGGSVKISVEDRGIGITADDMKHIFEPFYRARGVVDAQIHGNGLGLALVKEITEAHGGKVLAQSRIGKGSKFTIELPMPGPSA